MSDIYMEYLTESEREDLILEKEMDLIISDIDYLFTTYESADDNKKQGVVKRLLEKIGKLIDKLIHEIIPNLLKKIKTKEETAEKEIKALPAPNLNNYVKKVYVKNGIEATINIYDNEILKLDKLISKIDKSMSKNLSSEQLKKLYDEFEYERDNIFNVLLKRAGEVNKSHDYNDTFVPARDQNILNHMNNQISKMHKSIEYCKKIYTDLDNKHSRIFMAHIDNNKIGDEIEKINRIEIDIIQVIYNIFNMYALVINTYNGYINDIKIEYVAKDNDNNKTFAESFVTEKSDDDRLSFINSYTKINDPKNILSDKKIVKRINSAYSKQKNDMKKFLESLIKSWDMKEYGITSYSKLKKYMYLDVVRVTRYSSDYTSVIIWFNSNRSHQSHEFFGGHSFTVNINLYDDGKEKCEYQLEG